MASKRVQVVLPEDEAAHWEHQAKNAGLSVSSWVARIVRSTMMTEAWDAVERKLRAQEVRVARHEERITSLEQRITRVESGEVTE